MNWKNTEKLIKLAYKSTLLGILLTLFAHAYQTPHKHSFTATPPEKKQFIMENIYNYTQSRFVPPVVIYPVSRIGSGDATPEESCISFFSAMKAGDYEWWLSLWTAKSKELIAERNQQSKRTPQDWVASWNTILKDKQVVLVERLETGPYIILVYSLQSLGPISKETFRSLYAAKYQDGHWRATQELEKDPFFSHYLDGKDRTSMTIR
jgi:hypothetical protein